MAKKISKFAAEIHDSDWKLFSQCMANELVNVTNCVTTSRDTTGLLATSDFIYQPAVGLFTCRCMSPSTEISLVTVTASQT